MGRSIHNLYHPLVSNNIHIITVHKTHDEHMVFAPGRYLPRKKKNNKKHYYNYRKTSI